MTTNLKTPKVLDSFALLAFLNKEAGFDKVRVLLHTAEAAGEPLLMNEINVGEVFYIIAKARSPGKAEDFLLDETQYFADLKDAILLFQRLAMDEDGNGLV